MVVGTFFARTGVFVFSGPVLLAVLFNVMCPGIVSRRLEGLPSSVCLSDATRSKFMLFAPKWEFMKLSTLRVLTWASLQVLLSRFLTNVTS